MLPFYPSIRPSLQHMLQLNIRCERERSELFDAKVARAKRLQYLLDLCKHNRPIGTALPKIREPSSEPSINEHEPEAASQPETAVEEQLNNTLEAELQSEEDLMQMLMRLQFNIFEENEEGDNAHCTTTHVPENQCKIFDFIIYGATGLTGRQTIIEALKLFRKYSWAIAGRNEEKLWETLEDIGYQTERNVSRVKVVVAAADDENSLLAMVASCRVLLNCAGPSTLFGEALIKACLNRNTHYVDISFEPNYLTDMHEKYHEQALAKGVYILTSCGFQGFAHDILINRIDDTFSGLVHQIDCYMQFWSLGPIQPQLTLNFWLSLLYALKNPIKNLRLHDNFSWKTLINYNSSDREKSRKLMHKSHDVGSTINVAWPLLEQKICAHTQRRLQEIEQKPPIQFNVYLAFPSIFYAIIFLFWSSVVTFMCQVRCLRTLLEYLPALCSFGYVSAASSAMERQLLTELKYSAHYYVICGEPNVPFKRQNRQIVGMLHGINPFYGFTTAALLISGLNVLNNLELLPDRGGVYTPGVAFRNIDVLSDLSAYDHLFTFQLMEVEDGCRKFWCLI